MMHCAGVVLVDAGAGLAATFLQWVHDSGIGGTRAQLNVV